MTRKTNDAMVIAAIDLGSAQSGGSFGLSLKGRSFVEAAVVPVSPLPTPDTWPNPGAGDKVQTSILLHLDSKTLKYSTVAFGPKAAEMYHQIDAALTNDYFLFENFKMRLVFHNDKTNRESICHVLADQHGREVPTSTIMIKTLEHLHSSVLKEIQKSTPEKLEIGDIGWYVTVPAIWGEEIKAAMANWANLAGMYHASIVLESEAAAVCCLYDRMKQQHEQNTIKTFFNPPSHNPRFYNPVFVDEKTASTAGVDLVFPHLHDNKDEKYPPKEQSYANVVSGKKAVLKQDTLVEGWDDVVTRLNEGERIVVGDLGGGTADFTSHKVGSGGRLEATEASGGPWGSRKIEEALEKLLDTTFTAKQMGMYERQFPTDYCQMKRNIETLKHMVQPPSSQPKDYRLKLPSSFIAFTGLTQFVHNTKPVFLDPKFDLIGTRGHHAPTGNPPPTTAPTTAPSTSTTSTSTTAPTTAAVASTSTTAATTAAVASTSTTAPTTAAVASISTSARVATVELSKDALALIPKKDTNKQKAEKKKIGEEEKKKDGGNCLKEKGVCYRVLEGVWDVGYLSGSLRISEKLMLSIFDTVVGPIVAHIEQLLQKYAYPAVSTLILAGGFCSSQVLINAVQECVRKRNNLKTMFKTRLEFYRRPALSVLIGGVLFGLHPAIISSRVVTRFYGIDKNILLNGRNEHNQVSGCNPVLNLAREAKVCEGHFRLICSRGEVVRPDCTFPLVTKFPSESNQTTMTVWLYCTEGDLWKAPERIDSYGVRLLGKLYVEMPEKKWDTARQVIISVRFGTKIEFIATDDTTQQTFTTHIEFPQN